MGYKDLHDEPFDEGTITKLEIFEDYAQAWIPTFLMSNFFSEIYIFDFFAGTGYDKNGVPGSPIRILTKLKEQVGHIFLKKAKVVLVLNEYEPQKNEQKKFQLLQNACEEYLNNNKDLRRAIKVEYFNQDFQELFPRMIDKIRMFPSLVYIDQNGVKFLSDKYFLELEKTKTTDFLYFLSASYIWRFGNTKEFKEHISIDVEKAKTDPYKFIHKNILDQLRNRLPNDSKLKLYPFSIKKGTNIYGIIFGASHPRAVDKFLTVTWGKNAQNGQADFDIYDDSLKSQLDLFVENVLAP
jgi:three-Cys-motif partner protein